MSDTPFLTPHARTRWYQRAPSDAAEPWQALANAAAVGGLEDHDHFSHGLRSPEVVYGYGGTTPSGTTYWMVFIQVAEADTRAGHDGPAIVTTYSAPPTVLDDVRAAVDGDGGVVDETAFCTLTNSPTLHTDV